MSELDQLAIVPAVDEFVQQREKALGRVRSKLEADLPAPNPLLPRAPTQKVDTPNGKKDFCCWKSEEKGTLCKYHPQKRRRSNSMEYSGPQTVMEEQSESFANATSLDVTAGLREEPGPSSNQGRSLFQSPYGNAPSKNPLKGYTIPKKGSSTETNADKTISISPSMEKENPQKDSSTSAQNNDRNVKRKPLLEAPAETTVARKDKKVSRVPKQIASKNDSQSLTEAKKTLSRIQGKKKAAPSKRMEVLKEMDQVDGKCSDVELKRWKAINYLSSTMIRDLHPSNPNFAMDASCEVQRLRNHIGEIAEMRVKLGKALEKLHDGHETLDTDSLYRLCRDIYNGISVLEENNVPTGPEFQIFLDWAETDG